MLGVRSQVPSRPVFEPSLVSGPLCRINWANPVTRGLRFAFNGADWVDLVTGTVATKSGSPYRTVKFGVPCTRFDAATSDYLDFLGTGNLWNLTGPISVLWRGSFDTISGAYRQLVSRQVSGSNVAIDAYLDSGLGTASYVRGNGSGTSTQRLSASPPTAGLVNLLWTDDANPATTGIAYQDNVAQTVNQVTTGATSATSVPGSMRIGRRHDGVTQLTGYVASLLIWDRVLTVAEYFSLLAYPSQIYDYGGVNRLAWAGAAAALPTLSGLTYTPGTLTSSGFGIRVTAS